MMKHYRIYVQGTVQGVWFRKYTCEKALICDLKGMVRNEADGSVYAEAEGEEKNLKSFVSSLETGPPLSVVKSVRWEEGELKQYTKFEISR